MQAFRTQIIKINSVNLRNSCIRLSADAASRPTSAKVVEASPVIPEVVEASLPSAEEAVGPNASVPSESATTAAINVAARYNVVAERTFGGFSKPLSIAELNHKIAGDQQHLQPCKMREFCAGRDKDHVIVFPRNIDTKGSPAFAESKTRANLTLPLKPVKLASPFPEPVKVMISNTVSDEEKAQQMLAESKSQKMSEQDRSQALFAHRNYSTLNTNGVIMQPSNVRYYTTTTQPLSKEKKDKKCKKLTQTKEKSCPRYILPNCPPKAREHCEEGQKEVVCTKQESPYPAYSEFCHEDVIEKPSECKMCPWPNDKHPYFKPPKRKLHLSRMLKSRRTGLERLADRIKAAKAEAAALSEATKTMEAPGSASGSDVAQLGDAPKTLDDGMQCGSDMRKPPCKRPVNNPCATKPKPKQKKPKKPKKKEKCAISAEAAQAEKDASELMVENSINHMFINDQRLIDGLAEKERAEQEEPIMEAAKKKKGGGKKGKCQKLPFVPFDSPKRSPPMDRNVGGCPPKPKKPLVIDCPPDESIKCSGTDTVNAQVDSAPLPSTPKPYKLEYIMKKKKKDEKKCPKVNLQMNREEDEDDDPCKEKKKNTLECPNDLLPIRRRVKRPPPRKKVDSINSIPVDLTPESTQHQQPKM